MAGIDIEINISDAQQILSTVLSHYFKGVEVNKITITSWNQTLLVVDSEMLTHPVRHELRPEHRVLK